MTTKPSRLTMRCTERRLAHSVPLSRLDAPLSGVGELESTTTTSHHKIMPTYYCDTCQKFLQRHEQRHNEYEGYNGIEHVIRCVGCGSDARPIYAPDEKGPMSNQDFGSLMLFLIIGIPLLIIALLAIIATYSQ
jgi:hypothetical protein